MYEIAGGKMLHSTGDSARCSVVTWRGGMEGGEAQEERDTGMLIADSLNCLVETNYGFHIDSLLCFQY